MSAGKSFEGGFFGCIGVGCALVAVPTGLAVLGAVLGGMRDCRAPKSHTEYAYPASPPPAEPWPLHEPEPAPTEAPSAAETERLQKIAAAAEKARKEKKFQDDVEANKERDRLAAIAQRERDLKAMAAAEQGAKDAAAKAARDAALKADLAAIAKRRAAEAAAEKREAEEALAANALKLIRPLVKSRPGSAKLSLLNLIQTYPATKAAAEAREIFKGLP